MLLLLTLLLFYIVLDVDYVFWLLPLQPPLLRPVRGRRHLAIAAFLRHRLKLNVVLTDPEEHDRELAVVQGLTHFIAKVLQEMEPLPTRMTTSSFDMLTKAVSMVQDDAPEVFDAIENLNPHTRDIRKQFLRYARKLDASQGAPTR